MAILKDLIVHGSSRFLNKIYASEIQTPLIEAEAGIFKKLKADDATVVGLLDVKGQLHTNSWSNSNIATIDGSFYITPTIGSDSGTVTITASSLVFSGTNYAVSSLYLGDGSSITWPRYSKVLVTGQILSNGEWIPLGTLLGQLSATAAAASIKINNIKDNKNQTSSILTTLVNNGTTSSDYRNLKVSLYQRASSSTAFYPLGIYITAAGDNGRTFLDIYGGVNSLNTVNSNYGGLAEPNVRIGNLQGLPNVGGQSPNGWGIYTDNGYFKGIIAADRGYIGTGSKYWVIGNYEDGSNSDNDRSYIYNGTNSITSTTEGVYLGTDGIRNYKDSTHYVTIKNGVISALGVDLSGKITATSGTIGGASITNGTLIVSNANINDINASKINAGDIAAARIQTNLISAINAKVNDLSALTATIGGFQIDSSSIHTKSVAITSNADNSIALSSADFTRTINSTSRTGLRFAIGDKFGVTGDGTIYASNVDLTGKITATSGSIGGIEIENGALKVSSINIGNLGGASNYAQKTDVTQAIDNIEVGGRNLLKESDCLAPVQTSKGITITYNGNGWFNVNGTVTGTSAGVLCFYGNTSYTSNITSSSEYTLSIETDGTIFLPSNKTFIQLAYHSDNATNNTIAGEFEILSGSTKVTFTIPENHHISRVCLFIQANATGGVVDGNIRLKLEKGNKATAWTPAPEDIDDSISIVQTNADAVNLSPYFSYSPYVKNNYWHYWQNTPAITFTEVGDGWARIYCNNTSNSNIRRDFTPVLNKEIKEGADYTWLIEFRNNNSSGSSTNTDFYLVQSQNNQFFGGTIKENIEGKGTGSATSIITYVPIVGTTVDGVEITKDYVYKKRFIKVSEKTGTSAWTDGSADKVVALACFTARCAKQTKIDYEVRISLYEGRYLGEYKPYVDSAASGKIEDAKKVATNYLSMDSTGIMVADMNDGEQTPSTATGKNVFIDNDSVDIRNGQTVLSSFGNGIVTLGEADKARLELTTGSIKGISNQGVINFDITGQNIDGDGTLNDSGVLVNQATDEDRENGILFKATFRPNLNLNNYDSLTGSINFIFNNNEETYNFSYDVPDSEPWIIILPREEVVSSGVHYRYGIDMSGSYYTFTFVDLGSQITINIDNTISYNISITSTDYHDSSFSFGSRATSLVDDYSVGSNSCVIGEELVATSANQVAIGRYNYDNTEKYPNELNRRYAFMVGNGFLGAGRSNAFAVDWNGCVETGDVKATGLLLEENSKSEMDDYIKCVSAGDADIFKVAKNGVVNTTGAIKAPNTILRKPSSESGDYLLCEDENRNAKFRVVGSGGVITAGDVVVGGAETVNGNLYAKGRLLYNSTSTPLFKVVTRTIDNISIGADSGAYPSVAVNESGYTPIVIGGVTLGSASSGGTTYGWCIVQSFGINGQTLNFYVGNWDTNSAAKIKMVIKVLCIRTSAL